MIKKCSMPWCKEVNLFINVIFILAYYIFKAFYSRSNQLKTPFEKKKLYDSKKKITTSQISNTIFHF